MNRRMVPLFAAVAALPALSVAVPAAAATAPPNDNRASAQVIALPSAVRGTTVGATRESSEADYCYFSNATVWYKFTASDARGLVVSLHADGNLDAFIEVFQQRRSRLDGVNCDATDDNGQAATDFRTTKGATYFIRVSEQQGSEHNSFELSFVQGPPPAQPPGRSLPAAGAKGTLDRLLHVDAAYHARLSATQPYLINLVHAPDVCMGVALFPPGTKSFESASPVLSLGCGGYAVYTPPPGAGGRYVLRVTSDRSSRNSQPYGLLLGAARRDDIAPGLLLANFARHAGSVNGGSLDQVDLYRFDVAKRSALDLNLRNQAGRNLDLELRTDTGRRLRCACDETGTSHSISLRVSRGRYYVAVRSRDLVRSTYVLTRRSRSITRAITTVDGRRSTTVRPRDAVRIGVRVTQATTGRAMLSIEHFDPFQGWLPAGQRRLTLHRGAAQVRWMPPSIGRWRVRADYPGARRFAPSRSRYAQLLVADRLSEQALRAMR